MNQKVKNSENAVIMVTDIIYGMVIGTIILLFNFVVCNNGTFY